MMDIKDEKIMPKIKAEQQNKDIQHQCQTHHSESLNGLQNVLYI